MGDMRKVSDGLNLLYLGNIVAIVAALCTVVVFLLPPLVIVTALAVIVGGIMCLVGLVRLRNYHEDYMIALIATLAGIVCNILGKDNGLFSSLMSLASSVCSLLQIYFVVRGTNSFLTSSGYHAQAAMGDRAWKWQLIVIAISVVTLVLTLILPPLALVLVLVELVAGIVALIFFLSYLKASAAVLG